MDNVPVYFERWARYPNDTKGEKYMALRRNDTDKRDAIIIVVGKHFAVAIDRAVVPSFSYFQGSSANPSILVDASVKTNERCDAEHLLDLVGCYGTIEEGRPDNWLIHRCTHPWYEGGQFSLPKPYSFTFNDTSSLQSVNFGGDTWDVLECSFKKNEIETLFPSPTPLSKL
jgi:hypothetical protein